MNWKMIVFAAAFVVGCGKKKEPESAATAGPQVESTIGLVEVNRKANPEGPDQRWINAPVELKNNLGGAITVNKIEWHIDVGGQDLGNNAKEFNEQVDLAGPCRHHAARRPAARREQGARHRHDHVDGAQGQHQHDRARRDRHHQG